VKPHNTPAWQLKQGGTNQSGPSKTEDDLRIALSNPIEGLFPIDIRGNTDWNASLIGYWAQIDMVGI
jgi:hypothetical protein